MTKDQWIALAYAMSFWFMGALGMVAGICLERICGKGK